VENAFRNRMTHFRSCNPNLLVDRRTSAKGVGVDGPDGIDCARMRSLQISNKGDRPWNRLAELAWIHRNIFSSFMG